MTTSAETTVSSEESMRLTLRAVEDELLRVKTCLALTKAGLEFWMSEAVAQRQTALRLRSRLARVLRLFKADREWVGIPGGGVWSSRALTNKEPRHV